MRSDRAQSFQSQFSSQAAKAFELVGTGVTIVAPVTWAAINKWLLPIGAPLTSRSEPIAPYSASAGKQNGSNADLAEQLFDGFEQPLRAALRIHNAVRRPQ
jgi:hypothetical protein